MTPLLGRRARLRWLHLIIGGALLMPYFLVGTVMVGSFRAGANVFSSPVDQLIAFAFALPMASATALFPLARPLSVSAARALCGLPPDRPLADGPARTRQARVRAALWYTPHVALGGIVSGMTLALTPFAVGVTVLPFFAAVRESPVLDVPEALDGPWLPALAPFAGIAMLAAMAGCAAAAGALLANRAPVLLVPTPDDRLAAAERRAAGLAVRNQLARELDDSVGHALSAVTLQAGAARRVLDSDPEFVREALAATEETTRRTVDELDSVLGLLQRTAEDAETAGTAEGAGAAGFAQDTTGSGLDALDGLLARCGVPVSYTAEGDRGAVPGVVGREAYRIVQEGLSNALRHGAHGADGGHCGPVRLRITVRAEEVEIVMDSPLPARPSPAAPVRPGGGRGLRGVRERAVLLGGRAGAGPHAGGWRLTARLPLRPGERELP
ncbi:histidine kinase [Streptomyces sp. ITFR-6]|uniref:sensor histidine kinase n=1 Tax=Streptomyces sp. ITFR-6 TaxID=3075197 RepID=UPI00288952FF|nr:histidine kinase [Streptomyces sp. ITFR-6]WNI32682.1 histidine kinase [Streptomyces sp. ITFR-6]